MLLDTIILRCFVHEKYPWKITGLKLSCPSFVCVVIHINYIAITEHVMHHLTTNMNLKLGSHRGTEVFDPSAAIT
jgi:hypothetical protein